MSTTTEGSIPTLRDAIPEYMGPVLAIVHGLDHEGAMNADVARAIATLAMNAVRALDQADANHAIRQNPADEEWWEAEALCVGVATMAAVAAGEGGSKIPGPNPGWAFQTMQTYARMIRESWFSDE